MGFWQSFRLTTGEQPYLTRKGLNLQRFGVYIHHIDSPDPGHDLHDHPWPFVTLILRGGYTEDWAYCNSFSGDHRSRGSIHWNRRWNRFSVHSIRLDQCHRINAADPGTISLVVRGRKSRRWGFYTPNGYVDADIYRPEDRGLVKETA